MSSERSRSTMPPRRSAGSLSSMPPPGGLSGGYLSSMPPPPGLVELERSPYLVTRYDDAARLVVVTRLPAPYPDVDALVASYQRVEIVITHVPRLRAALLVDARRAPARNDAVFERAFAPIRQRIIGGFRRKAILVETAVGALQVTRHARLDGVDQGIYTDLTEALAYLEVQVDPHLIDLPDPAP